MAKLPLSTQSSRWQKEKNLNSSANERKYTQIYKSKKINHPQINADEHRFLEA